MLLGPSRATPAGECHPDRWRGSPFGALPASTPLVLHSGIIHHVRVLLPPFGPGTNLPAPRGVAYPIGLKGVVVGEGDNYEDALADVRSAIALHVETFGPDAIEIDQPVFEAFIAEARFAV